MIKQHIKFYDVIEEKEVEKDFYFHLNKAEIIRILSRAGEVDWETYVRNILDSNDPDKILNLFESIIHDAVGQRTPEGLFVKTKDFRDAFIASEAYGELFVKFLSEEEFAQKFWQSIIAEGKSTTNLKAIAAEGKSTTNVKAIAASKRNRAQRRNNNRGKNQNHKS